MRGSHPLPKLKESQDHLLSKLRETRLASHRLRKFPPTCPPHPSKGRSLAAPRPEKAFRRPARSRRRGASWGFPARLAGELTGLRSRSLSGSPQAPPPAAVAPPPALSGTNLDSTPFLGHASRWSRPLLSSVRSGPSQIQLSCRGGTGTCLARDARCEPVAEPWLAGKTANTGSRCPW